MCFSEVMVRVRVRVPGWGEGGCRCGGYHSQTEIVI